MLFLRTTIFDVIILGHVPLNLIYILALPFTLIHYGFICTIIIVKGQMPQGS